MFDSATRMGFLLFLPFLLTAKGASMPAIGLALTLVFAGGAAGKLVCAFIGARIGAIATVWLTEGLTAVLIVALLPLPLEAAFVLLPVIGIALNGTSSVLYGSVPDLVTAERRARAFSIFYTGTIGSGAAGARALRPGRRCARRHLRADRGRGCGTGHAAAVACAQAGALAAAGLIRFASPLVPAKAGTQTSCSAMRSSKRASGFPLSRE